MDEIYAWRRKIHSRPKTPVSSRPQPHSTANLLAPPSLAQPKSRSKKAFTRVLSLSSTASSSSSRTDRDPFSYDAWSKMTPPKPQTPDVEQACQSVMTTLLSHPTQPLPASFNSLIMRIIESHTKLRLEGKRLHNDLEDAQLVKQKLVNKLRFDAAEWDRKEFKYEDELHRLRSSSNGISSEDSFKALCEPERQASDPLRPGRQTVYEFINDSGRASTSSEHSPKAPRMIPRSPLQSPTACPASSTNLLHRMQEREGSRDSFSTAPESETGPTATMLDGDAQMRSLQRLSRVMAQRNGLKVEDALAQLFKLFFGEDNQTLSTTIHIGKDQDTQEAKSDLANDIADKLMPTRERGLCRGDGRAFSFNPGDESSFQTRDLLTAASLQSVEQSLKQPKRRSEVSGNESSSPSVSAAKKAVGLHKENVVPQLSPSKHSRNKSRIPSPAVSQVPTAGRRRRETSSSVATTIRRSIPLEAGALSTTSSRHTASRGSSSQNSSRGS